jgi:hypothetical protein
MLSRERSGFEEAGGRVWFGRGGWRIGVSRVGVVNVVGVEG